MEYIVLVKTIFYINLVLFLLTLVIPRYVYGLLSMGGFDSDYYLNYQLITYQFLHGGFLHLLFNMLVLLSFAPSVEEIYGTKRFWVYYLLCGVGAALLHGFIVGGSTPLVGASGSLWGIMVMNTFIFPNDKIHLFLIPIGIKAKYLIFALFLFEIFGSFFRQFDGIAHLAHIGGAITGLLLYFYNRIKK